MKNSLVRQAMPPEEEFARRLKNVRAKMEDRGIDVLAVYSGPGSLRFGQRGHVMYLTGYEPYFGDTMAILPRDGSRDTLLELDEAHYFTPECTWVKNVKPARDHVNTLNEYLRENKLEKSKVGTARIGVVLPAIVAVKMGMQGDAPRGLIAPERLDPTKFLKMMTDMGAPVKFQELRSQEVSVL